MTTADETVFDAEARDIDNTSGDEKRPVVVVHVDRVTVAHDVDVGVEDELAGGEDVPQNIDRVDGAAVADRVVERLRECASELRVIRDIEGLLGLRRRQGDKRGEQRQDLG
jgi:hypothetical protein